MPFFETDKDYEDTLAKAKDPWAVFQNSKGSNTSQLAFDLLFNKGDTAALDAKYKPSVLASAAAAAAEDSRRKEKSKILADAPGARRQTRMAESMAQAANPMLSAEDATYAYRLV